MLQSIKAMAAEEADEVWRMQVNNILHHVMCGVDDERDRDLILTVTDRIGN